MPIQIQGNGGTVAEVDGTNFRALRVNNRPVDYGALGWSAQLAAYAHSQLYDVDKGERLPTPPIDKTTGLIIHLPAGKGVSIEVSNVARVRG